MVKLLVSARANAKVAAGDAHAQSNLDRVREVCCFVYFVERCLGSLITWFGVCFVMFVLLNAKVAAGDAHAQANLDRVRDVCCFVLLVERFSGVFYNMVLVSALLCPIS